MLELYNIQIFIQIYLKLFNICLLQVRTAFAISSDVSSSEELPTLVNTHK